MKGFTFRQQVSMGVVMMIIAYILAYMADTGYIVSICWTFFGLAFIVNPVAPETIRLWFKERTPNFMRILGAALIFGGWLSTADLGLG